MFSTRKLHCDTMPNRMLAKICSNFTLGQQAEQQTDRQSEPQFAGSETLCFYFCLYLSLSLSSLGQAQGQADRQSEAQFAGSDISRVANSSLS